MKTEKRWGIMGVPYNQHAEFYRNMEAVKKMTASAHKTASEANKAKALDILKNLSSIHAIEPLLKDGTNG